MDSAFLDRSVFEDSNVGGEPNDENTMAESNNSSLSRFSNEEHDAYPLFWQGPPREEKQDPLPTKKDLSVIEDSDIDPGLDETGELATNSAFAEEPLQETIIDGFNFGVDIRLIFSLLLPGLLKKFFELFGQEEFYFETKEVEVKGSSTRMVARDARKRKNGLYWKTNESSNDLDDTAPEQTKSSIRRHQRKRGKKEEDSSIP